jgi:type I restriction enzyme S subunit
MSSRWPRATLAELTEKERSITYGVVKPGDEVEGGIAFVRGGDVVQGRILIDTLRTISPQLSQTYKRTLLRGGELLVSLVGNPGEVAIAPDTLAGANIARQVGLVALRPEFDSRFYMYYLMSPMGKAEFFSRTGGAVQQVINLADLKTVSVPLPSESEQIEIASILSNYDDLIENNRRRMALLEESARLLYREWFVRLRFPGYEHTPIVEGVPQGWERAPLESALVLQRGFDLPTQDRQEGVVPIYGSTGVLGYHDKVKAIAPGVVTGRSGTLGEVQYVAEDYWPLNTALWVKEFKRVTPLFALFLLREMDLRQFNGGASVPTLDRKSVHRVEILIPSTPMLRSFDEFALDVFAQIKNLVTQNQKLRAARDLLLPRLMSGELAV